MHTWKKGENDPNFEFFFKRQPVCHVKPQTRNKTGIQFAIAQIARIKIATARRYGTFSFFDGDDDLNSSRSHVTEIAKTVV
jgi:hypothetical protein